MIFHNENRLIVFNVFICVYVVYMCARACVCVYADMYAHVSTYVCLCKVQSRKLCFLL